MKNISVVIAAILVVCWFSGPAFSGSETELQKGLSLYNSGKYEEAARYFKEYVKEKPSASVYYMIGYSLYELGRHDEATRYFDDAYLIDPEFTPLPPE